VILIGGDSNNLSGPQPNGAVVVIAEPRSGDAVLKNLIVNKKLAILWSSHDLKYLGPVVALIDLDRLVCEFHRPTGNDAQSENTDDHPSAWIHEASAVHLVSTAPNEWAMSGETALFAVSSARSPVLAVHFLSAIVY
jgi:hypothetical protein